MIPRQSAPRRHGGRIAAAIALAILAHVLAVAGVVVWSSLMPSPPRAPRTQEIALRTISADEWAKNRGQAARSRTKPPPETPEKKAKDLEAPGQVVAVAPGNDQRPDEAKYAAEHDNKVDRETRARDTTAFYKNAMPRKSSPHPEQATNPEEHDATPEPRLGIAQGDAASSGRERQAHIEIPEVQARTEIAMKEPPSTSAEAGLAVPNREESARVEGNSKRLLIDPGGDSAPAAGGSTIGRANEFKLLPSPSAAAQILGGAANDRLDVPEGDGTYLNTREFRYAGFFNRVKQAVGMQWNPERPLRARDPSGQIYAGKDRETLLNVTLDASGRLVDVEVSKSCGLAFLDLEAVQSFQRAQPFPNPPPGLVAADSTVRFQFGFFLEMNSGGPRLRLFRGEN